MDLDDYQKEALRTAPRDPKAYRVPEDLASAVLGHVENIPDYDARWSTYRNLFEPLMKDHDQMVWSLGLAGEAGEFVDIMKKHHGHGHELDRTKAAKELGDVLWYVSVLANSMGYKLSDIARMNVEKLRARYKDGFTISESKNRKDQDVP